MGSVLTAWGRESGEDWLTRKQAAEYLRRIGCPISAATLAKRGRKQNAGKGPPYNRSGWRTIRYKRKDLAEWAERTMERVE